MEKAVDHVLPEGKWEFDDAVTEVFDDMLSRSIPQYEEMRNLTFEIGSRFVQPLSTIVDLGASRGDGLVRYLDRFGARNRFVAVEISEPMRAAMERRFAGLISTSVIAVRQDDLRRAYPPVNNVSLTLGVLTAMFVPIEYRQRLFANIYASLAPGGALVLVEKVLGNGALLDDIFVDRYLKLKAEQGYSQDEITRKRLSLEGVLVPVTAEWNVQMLHTAGFRTVDSFWRWLNFTAWIAVK